MRCPKGPNKFVPIRYEILAGRNDTPCCHLSAPIVSIIQIGREGSNMAMPVFANVIAPEINKTNFLSENYLDFISFCVFFFSYKNRRYVHCIQSFSELSLYTLSAPCCKNIYPFYF